MIVEEQIETGSRNMDYQKMKQELDRQGYTVVRGLLTPEEVDYYIGRMEALSGITRAGMQGGEEWKGSGRGSGGSSWTLPDGVAKSRDFWPIIFNERLLEIVRNIVDPDVRFLQHNDIHVGFSAISWHRDSVNREYGVGPDWDETDTPYKLVRCGIYLQTFAESNSRLGFIPGSHKPPVGSVSRSTKFNERKLKWLGAANYLSPKIQMAASSADWIPTEPGDCVIFDPRTIHSGSYITGPKYSVFVAYGVENKHFFNHYNYYRNIRSELGYADLDEEFVQMLKDQDLYPELTPTLDYVEGAWVPSSIVKSLYARRRDQPAETSKM
jgi:ectoine hydroxylase-related dioxygenase (phytanoyl-CoA dioxygenase family)